MFCIVSFQFLIGTLKTPSLTWCMYPVLVKVWPHRHAKNYNLFITFSYSVGKSDHIGTLKTEITVWKWGRWQPKSDHIGTLKTILHITYHRSQAPKSDHIGTLKTQPISRRRIVNTRKVWPHRHAKNKRIILPNGKPMGRKVWPHRHAKNARTSRQIRIRKFESLTT